MTLSVMSVGDEVPKIARVPSMVLVKVRRHLSKTLSLMSVEVEVPEVVPVPNLFLVPFPDTSVAG